MCSWAAVILPKPVGSNRAEPADKQVGSVVHTEPGEGAGWDYGKVGDETIFRRNCKGMCPFKLQLTMVN